MQVQVVSDEEQPAGAQLAVDAPGGIGDHQKLGSQLPQHPHREDDFLRGIPLIEVHPALHHGHRDPVASAQHQATGVADRGGNGEMRDLPERDGRRKFQLVGKGPQART